MLSATSVAPMNKQLLETIHRATYMADCRRAAALGLTEPEYRGARRRAVEEWTTTIRAAMVESNVNDPIEVLPDLFATVVEKATIEAREAGKVAARRELQRRLAQAAKP
jgi:hypothetical protein